MHLKIFLLDSESDEDYLIAFTRRPINILILTTNLILNYHQNRKLQVPKIVWQSESQTNHRFYRPGKGDYPTDHEGPCSPTIHFGKIFDGEIISDVDYTNTYALQLESNKTHRCFNE